MLARCRPNSLVSSACLLRELEWDFPDILVLADTAAGKPTEGPSALLLMDLLAGPEVKPAVSDREAFPHASADSPARIQGILDPA